MPILVSCTSDATRAVVLGTTGRTIVGVLESRGVACSRVTVLSEGRSNSIGDLRVSICGVGCLGDRVSGRVSGVVNGQRRCGLSVPLNGFFSAPCAIKLKPQLSFGVGVAAATVISFRRRFGSTNVGRILRLVGVGVRVGNNFIIT